MPGVPPDGIDRLKKGIKGLFSKNKKSRDSQSFKSTGESSKTEASKPPTTTTTQPAEEEPTDSAKAGETGTGEKKDEGDATQGAGVTATETQGDASKPEEPVKPEEAGTAVREAARQEAVGSMPPEAKPREHAEGMSATSGPLQDDPEFAHAAQ
ncbi:hypothetical protein EV356DRAFT_104615 [Viridothelium virens]|uniref:Uncharacterized protein n=1 Tax=Viridothelium virens TaxID=1048519 RepID=A0A6A6HQ71_VIRVR|nr:hypothetical protein EV356DRAFT_104615 [Viridothelium virens]